MELTSVNTEPVFLEEVELTEEQVEAVVTSRKGMAERVKSETDKFCITNFVDGKGNVFLSYQNNQYGTHWAWDMENLVTYDSQEKAERHAEILGGVAQTLPGGI